MIVITIGSKNGGRSTPIDLPEEATIEDLANALDVVASKNNWVVDGQNASENSALHDGARVIYTMRDMKGA